jgi:hypothetical protein
MIPNLAPLLKLTQKRALLAVSSPENETSLEQLTFDRIALSSGVGIVAGWSSISVIMHLEFSCATKFKKPKKCYRAFKQTSGNTTS